MVCIFSQRRDIRAVDFKLKVQLSKCSAENEYHVSVYESDAFNPETCGCREINQARVGKFP